MMQAHCSSQVAAAPQAGFDTPNIVGPAPATHVGISDCSCGQSGCQSCRRSVRRPLFARRAASSDCGDIRCPDCSECFPEETCSVRVEQIEETKECFEIDVKTICIPKVVPPWKQQNNTRSCGGSCDGACDGNALGGCDSGGCDGQGGCCDSGQCPTRNFSLCKKAGCDPNAPHKCCPSSECAEVRSVKILKVKKYKCPSCRCRWEVVKPQLPAVPETPQTQPAVVPQHSQPATPDIQQPFLDTKPTPAADYYQGSGARRTLQDRIRSLMPARRQQVASAKPEPAVTPQVVTPPIIRIVRPTVQPNPRQVQVVPAAPARVPVRSASRFARPSNWK